MKQRYTQNRKELRERVELRALWRIQLCVWRVCRVDYCCDLPQPIINRGVNKIIECGWHSWVSAYRRHSLPEGRWLLSRREHIRIRGKMGAQ